MPDLNGILLIDKPAGFTSFDVVAKMRGIAQTRKIGHAGTLDPMATGVLPLFFGRATKACDILPRQDKRYAAQFRLGIETDTQDITGKILAQKEVSVTPEQVCGAAEAFLGDSMQVPPMYSAIKIGGQKLCDLARRGVEVERAARPVSVYSITCRLLDTGDYELLVHCSKGTYIRTLIADIGSRLGCGAVMTALRRTMAASFLIEDCITLEKTQQLAAAGELAAAMLPVQKAFQALPCARLSETQARMFLNGVRLDPARVQCPKTDAMMGVYDASGRFLGTAQRTDGALRMVKRFAE